MGLGRIGVSIWWQGLSGMSVTRLKSQIRTMNRFEDPPNFLILHIAGNDIGVLNIGQLRAYVKEIISWMGKIMPNVTIIWSQILPRLHWQYSQNQVAMSRCRYSVNNAIASFILRGGGCYIRHPDIKANETFLSQDGVHLTPLATELFLNNIQGAIELIVTYGGSSCTFPM